MMYKPTISNTLDKFFIAALLGLASLTSPPVFADRQQAADYYEDAVVLHKNDKNKEAVIQLKNALQQDSGLLPARVLLGTIYMETGDNQSAEKELHEAERLGADRSLTAIPLARAYLKQYKYEELISELTLENYPSRIHGELLSFRGQAYLELLDFDNAQKSFAQALKLVPDSPYPYNGMALLALRRGDTNDAARHIDKALKLAPRNVDALNINATIIHARGDLQGSARAYGKVLTLHPNDLKSRLARAGVYIDLKQYSGAAEDLKYLEEHYPLEPRTFYLQSLLYAYTDQPDKSKEALLKTASLIRALQPDFLSRSRQHLLLAGLTNYALGNFEQASLHLKNLVQLTPDALTPKMLLAATLLQLKQYADVIALLQPVVDRQDTRDYKLLTLLGKAYMLQGSNDKAIALLERATAINSEYSESRTSLGLSYYNAGEPERAVDQLSAALNNGKQESNAGAVLATIYLKQNNPAKALDILTPLVVREPDNPTYLHLLGSAQVMLRDYDSARSSFLKLETLDPNSISTQIDLARLDALTSKPDKARKRLQAAMIMKGAYVPSIMLELAKNEDIANNTREAIHWAEKARSEDINFIDAKQYLVAIYRRTGKYSKALDIALETQRIQNRKNLDTMRTIAELYIELNDYSKARAWLTDMSTQAGFDSRWLYRIAQLQYRINEYKDAEYSLQKAVQGKPDFIEAQVALIEILTGLNKLDEAETRINSLKNNVNFKEGNRLLGDIAVRRGNTQKAVHHYRLAMADNPTSLLTIKLYQAYATGGEWKNATSVVQQWLKKQPEDMDVREALAEAYLRQNQPTRAQEEYETILKARPDSPRLLGNLAYVYLQTGNDNALETAQKAYQLDPENASINDTLGWILVKQGDAKNGLTYLREAHSRESNDPEIRFHIAVALSELGRTDEAIAELKQALSSDRPFSGIREARALQKELEARQRQPELD